MTNLSPAAQYVLNAYYTEADRLDREVSHEEMLAAALRAAASQFDRPKRSDAHTLWNEGFQYAQNVCRAKLFAIADELEGVKYGTYRCNLEDKPQ
jgi:hypothetical protein